MAAHLGTHKDIEAAARKARKRGWTVEITRGNHIRWTAPDGRSFQTGLTMSSAGVATSLRRLRREGAID